MKDWEEWEIDLLEVYKKQMTTTRIVAKLLGRSEEEVVEKMSDMNDKR